MRDSPHIPAHANTSSTDLKRRRFLLAVSAGGAGAVAAVSPARAAVAASTGPSTAATGAGYQETEHVKRYYESTRT